MTNRSKLYLIEDNIFRFYIHVSESVKIDLHHDFDLSISIKIPPEHTDQSPHTFLHPPNSTFTTKI